MRRQKSLLSRTTSILTALAVALALAATGCAGAPREASPETEHTLAVLTTTDLHQYIMPYDYINDRPDETIGISKIYTLVEAARQEYAHTLLLSAGDDIQGSLVGDLEAEVQPLQGDETQAIILAMNAMNYDAAAVGNHEVTDFGLDFFERAQRGSDFPWLSANIMRADNPEEFYTDPYVILEREIDGIPIRIGVVGFVPPHIMDWGRRHLQGKVTAPDIVEQARKIIPRVREKSDIVIALAHTGIDPAPEDSYSARGNAAWWLAQVPGIDALALGHQHRRFPGDFASLAEEHPEGIDNDRGLLQGVPAVMPGAWGRNLGVIELNLRHSNGTWQVVSGQSHLRPVTEEVASHPLIEEIVRERHEQTLAYVRTPIGATEREIASFFSRLKDTAVTQIVNEAQLWYARQLFAGTEWEDTPILSAAAPFIAGRNGPLDFTRVTDDVNIGDVTDLYVFPNTVFVAKLDGLQVRDWLERSAENFNRIDPASTEPQHLVDYNFRAYNFDVIEGIEYLLDVTRPAGERVVSATFEGTELNEEMVFLVVTNNYRGSGGGSFPHMTEENILMATTDINREQIINYISQRQVVNPEPSRNWRIKPVETAGPLYFSSSPLAVDYVERHGLQGLSFLEEDSEGWAVFTVDLSRL